MYTLYFSPQAKKDAKKLAASNLEYNAQKLLDLLIQDPFIIPPPYKKLVGDLSGYYARRINKQHRLVYAVDITNRYIKIIRMWSHYE